ncbi:MAG: acyltransferase domain-containing protein, partial [Myxococcota bacterium]
MAVAALRAMAEGRASKGVAHRAAGEPGPVVFVCGGHGSQWPHMGRELFDASDAFRKTIEACDAALAPHVGWSVQSVLRGIDGPDVPPIDRVDVVQPALFAMSLGLAAAWKAWGIRPDAVVGHSVGEIAAAVIAGALSLADGARIVALRGRLIRRVAQGGGMLHIAQPANDVAPRLEAHARKLSIAVINTPSSAVVSGCLGALETLEQALVADGVQSRRVNIAFAAHSPFMDPIVDELREALEDLTPRPTEIPLYSSLSGAVVQGEHLDAAYWCRNVRDPVRFGETAAALAHDDFGVFIELGGHPVLSEPLQHAVKHRPETVVVASARRNRGGLDALHTAVGQLHAAGHPVDWLAVGLPKPNTIARLPTYAFQRTRYWLEAPSSSTQPQDLGLSPTAHPLLSTQTRLANRDAWMFSGRLNRARLSWLSDH